MTASSETHARKSLIVAVGHSADVEVDQAAAAAIESAAEQLQGAEPAGGLLFASVEYDHANLLAKIQARWPGLPVVGGTTDGELSSSGGFQPDSVLLVLFAGEGLRAACTVGQDLDRDLNAAVAQAVAGLPDEQPTLLLTAFAPSANACEVLRQLEAQLGPRNAPVVGGLSGDHRDFQHMVESAGSDVHTNSLPLLALYGDFKASWGMSSGWFPVGDEHRITRSEGNVVHEIDGRRAIDFYRHYYGEIADNGLAEYPLAMYVGDTDEYNMRAILGADPEQGTLTFAGELLEGARVRLTEVVSKGVLDGTRASMEQAIERYPGDAPHFALVFACAARQWVLGGRAAEELEVVRAALPKNGGIPIGVAGFYGFGEIAPGAGRGPSLLQNETCVSLLLGD